MKYAGLRVDIDNIADATTGLKGLREILDENDVRCTLFVNMGRSIDYLTLLRDIRRTANNVAGKTASCHAKISIKNKLGKKALLQTLLLNPKIGPLGKNVLAEMLKAGNELGLHGGRNHTIWQRRGDKMSKQQVFDELSWGKQQFERLFEIPPIGFSSPGFVTTPDLETVLSELGFSYHSNTVGQDKLSAQKEVLYDIPVNVVGPETIPLVEHLYANGRSADEIASEVNNMFERICSAGGIPVIYSHPSVAGNLLAGLYSELLHTLVGKGWKFVPLKEILDGN